MGHPIHKHMNSGMSRKTSPLNDFKGGFHKVQHAKGEAHKSPANNITYGDKSGPTGYIGEQRADDMKYNPVDDRAGMSRYGKDHGDSPAKAAGNMNDHGMTPKDFGKHLDRYMDRPDNPAFAKHDKSHREEKKKTPSPKAGEKGMSRQKYGGNKGDERRSATKDYDGMSRYGGNKGDIKRSAKKDY